MDDKWLLLSYTIIIYFVLVGVSMMGVGIAILSLDFLGVIKNFLDTFNDDVYVGVVVTLIVIGSLFVFLGIFIFLSTFYNGSCDKTGELILEWLPTALYFIMAIVTFVAWIFGCIFLNDMNNPTQMESRMLGQVKNNYLNETSPDQYSVVWNGMQAEFDCCGAIDYRDYRNSSYSASSGNLVPYTCCKNRNAGDVAVCRQEAMISIDPKCDGGSPTVGNWVQLNPCGCHADVAYILEQAAIAFFVLTFLALLPMIAFLLVLCVRYC